MTAPTNTDERHNLRLLELRAAKAIIRDQQAEIDQRRAEYCEALVSLDVLERTLAQRTDALTLALAEIAALKAGPGRTTAPAQPETPAVPAPGAPGQGCRGVGQ